MSDLTKSTDRSRKKVCDWTDKSYIAPVLKEIQ